MQERGSRPACMAVVPEAGADPGDGLVLKARQESYGGDVSERMVAFSTVGNAEDAERIARALVEQRLAACVNVVTRVVSIYRWRGAVERDEESLLVIKTRASQLEALGRALVALHSYEVPELVAVPIEGGSERYLAWLDESVPGPQSNGS